MPSTTWGKLVSGVAVGLVFLVSLYGAALAQRNDSDEDIMSIENIGNSDETLSGPQQLAWLDEQLSAAAAIRVQVEAMLDQARKDKETLKITCLDDKLAQIIVNQKGMEERGVAMQADFDRSDRASANQHFMILKIYSSRILGLKAEAESCIGESDVVLGDAETIVEVDEGITKEDPSEDGLDLPWVDQPPHASGFY